MENNISFGARFIKKLPVLKYSYEHKFYKPSSANFVQINPYDKNDVKALNLIAQDFGEKAYADDIYVDVKKAYERNDPAWDADMEVFALTKQVGNFNELNPDEVLGVAEITKNNNKEIELEYLSTNPQYIYSYEPPCIKKIGTAIINFLKEKYDKILLNSSPSAREFYRKNGFTLINENFNKFMWKRDN